MKIISYMTLYNYYNIGYFAGAVDYSIREHMPYYWWGRGGDLEGEPGGLEACMHALPGSCWKL